MTADIHIRVATAADEPAVSALYEASYPALMRASYAPDVLSVALPLMVRANRKLLTSGRFFVAFSADDKAVGCGGWSLERPGGGELEPGLGHIRHFATHPAFLKQGIGRAVFNACSRDAGHAGCIRLECYSSLNGEAFYAALGFRRISVVQVPMGPHVGFPAVWMVCDLA